MAHAIYTENGIRRDAGRAAYNMPTNCKLLNNSTVNCKVSNNSTVYQSGYSLQSVGDYDPGFSPSLFFAKVLTGKTSSFQNPFLVS